MTQTKTLYAAFADHISAALDALEAAGTLPVGLNRAAITVEPPRDPSHGDLATNAAMVLAKPAGTNPRALAEALVAELTKLPSITSAEIAGPGFINLRIGADAWLAELRAVAAAGAEYGRSAMGAGSTVNVEYVSANPTGPMHMGHCRGAVVGDALASLLEWAGHKVIREYYVNDAGGQVDVLARSVHLRYREAPSSSSPRSTPRRSRWSMGTPRCRRCASSTTARSSCSRSASAWRTPRASRT